MRTTVLAMGVAALLVMGGCRNKEEAYNSQAGTSTPAVSQSAAATDPEQLGQIGAQIKKHPARADKILSEHGMTQASFEKAIRTVSSDPAASRRYREAYRRAGA